MASKYDHTGFRSQAHELEKSLLVEVRLGIGLQCDRLKCLLDVEILGGKSGLES